MWVGGVEYAEEGGIEGESPWEGVVWASLEGGKGTTGVSQTEIEWRLSGVPPLLP